ncbi:hypothetical protein [Hungatella effluvii]
MKEVQHQNLFKADSDAAFFSIGKFVLWNENPPGDAHSALRKFGC